MKKIIPFFLLISLSTLAQKNSNIKFEDYLSLRNLGNPIISPDGKNVVFSVTTVDWKENAYDTEIWLSKNKQAPFQLTRTTKGSSLSANWSPDNKWIAFLADRGDKNQIYVIRAEGGEAQAITKEEEGINNFNWSPDGKTLAILMNEKDSKSQKSKKERYGGFEVDDEEFKLAHLWLVDFSADMFPSPNEKPCYDPKDSTKTCVNFPKPTRLTQGDFTVTYFKWSPDGSKIAFAHQPNSLIQSGALSNISYLEIASKKKNPLVENGGGDFLGTWSPDSKSILYTTSLNDIISNYYKNSKTFSIDLETKSPKQWLADFDENINIVEWANEGLYFTASQKTKAKLFLAENPTGKFKEIQTKFELINNPSFSKDAKQVAFLGRSYDELFEVQTGEMSDLKFTTLTNMNAQIKNWQTANSEVIKWKSRDGAEIEGVLHKPKNYDPSKKYPLLVMIHGGPTGVDLPTPTPGGSVYPILQFLEKGALVLRPNYRGSAGYGEAFRSLNVRNLGIGDMWDVMSGVDFLKNKGMIDTTRMGSMGWSQGGYISAFLTTNTNVFKAISVGAGISNWITYYVSTDIHPFTRQYLKSTPWNDKDIYLKTSPMTNINNASTPTLIQHGELDRRVPISNAYELLQGLQDKGIPSELVVYKGFGHGITKPKERLAALWHNWMWFNKYIWKEVEEMPLDK